MAKKFYITTAIDYINDKPHLGHAYEKIAADVLARYYRLQGFDVFFLTGTDENSQKTQIAAEKANLKINQYADKMAKIYKETWRNLNISFDYFIRTTIPKHKKITNIILAKVDAKKDVYRGIYKGLYCVGSEEFVKKEDLVKGLCPNSKDKPIILEEENYFFNLIKYQDWLLDYLEKNPFFIQPVSRYNETLSFIKRGLQNVSISRPNKGWGVTFGIDRKQVHWVWFDALLNYVSSLDYPSSKFKKYWPPDVQIVGKDILRFHALIWPVMLKSAGLILPKMIFAHGFITNEGQKMSKSLGNFIDPLDLVKKYGSDVIRYFLMRETPFGEDGDFSIQALENRYLSDLANDLGNLLQRTLTLIVNNDYHFVFRKPKMPAIYHNFMQNLKFKEALDWTFGLVGQNNQYIDQTRPWQYQKGDSKQRKILEKVYRDLEMISLAIEPFMPQTASKMQNELSTLKIQPLYPKV